MAMGLNPVASAAYSIALGTGVSVSGASSIALGQFINVRGGNSFGFGTINSNSVVVDQDDVFVVHGANVGIGEVDPGAELDILDGPDDDYHVCLRLRSAGTNHDSSIEFYEAAAAAMSIRYDGGRNSLGIWDLADGDVERVTVVRDSGRVGIGATSPSERLTVKMEGTEWGDDHFALEASGSVDKWDFTVGGSDTLFIGYNESSKFVMQTDGDVGIGTTDPGNYKLYVNGSAAKPGGGSWANPSDLKLKKEVKDMEGALKKMLQLRGVTFKWRNPEEQAGLTGTQMGMIAQEVETVFPDWVARDGSGYQDVTFRGFEALTVEAIRELKKENDRLKAQIAALEVKLSSIRER